MNKSHFWRDALTMTGRVVRASLRSIDTIVSTLAMPIMMMLAFVYIFGSAMTMPTGDYVNFIVPGVLLMCVGTGISYSAVRVNVDLTTGIFDRFHSMPIAKSSILGGHVLASLLLNTVSLGAILLVSFLVGFRPQANALEWLLAAAILLLSILSMTWMAVAFGLMAKSYEGAGMFSYVLIGLMFVSSAFVPTDNMSAGLRAFAQRQPMTPIAGSVRSLLTGQPDFGAVWAAVLWCAGIGAAFYLLAMAAYKRRMR
jgi:ABC-2 type transport system permease protein